MKRAAAPREVHAVPVDGPGGHRVTMCICRPVQFRDLAEPSRLVYVHRQPALSRPTAGLSAVDQPRPHSATTGAPQAPFSARRGGPPDAHR
jgi:hypothetical protein